MENNEIQNHYTERFRAVRRDVRGAPDLKDLREVRASVWADREFREAVKARAEEQRLVGARGGYAPRVGSGAGSSLPGVNYAVRTAAQAAAAAACGDPRNGSCGYSADPGCLNDVACKADLLGFTTIGRDGFPLAGTAAGAVGDIFLQPTATSFYDPAYLFIEARDPADSLSAVIGLITDATINSFPQLRSSGITGGIPTSAFSVDTPLDVRSWGAFGSETNQRLNRRVGSIINGVSVHFFGVFWGDSLGCLPNAPR